MSDGTTGEFGVWAILELMGHVKLAGYVTEEELFGSKVGRIDVPCGEESGVTQYFGGQSVYRLTPVTEEVARAYARNRQPAPVTAWELPELREAREELWRLRALACGDGEDPDMERATHYEEEGADFFGYEEI